MVNLFGDTFNKKVFIKLAGENLKDTRAQYREKMQIDLKHECPPMVSEKGINGGCKWKLVKRQGKKPWLGKARYNTYHIFIEILSILFFFVLSNNCDI